MKNRKYEKVTNNKIAVKGELSADCSYITFINDDKDLYICILHIISKCPIYLQKLT